MPLTREEAEAALTEWRCRMNERLARIEHALTVPETPVHWPWLHGDQPSEREAA